MMKKKKALAMSVLCAVASVGFVMGVSAETMHGNLEEVIVEGSADVLPGGMVAKTGNVGIIGNKNVMDVPFSQTNITSDAMETFGGMNQPLDNILVNIPSVRQTGTMLHGDFSVRGKSTNGSFFYLNGVPGMLGQFTVPTFMAESIQVTEGPNKAISGSFPTGEGTGVAAVVNVDTKKALDKPVLRYKQVFSGESGLGEYLDIGKRFGKNKEWGVRVNTEVLNGNPGHYKASKEGSSIFANIDHQDADSKSNLLVGYQYYEVDDGMRWFGFDAGNVNKGLLTHVPSAPNSKNNYSFPGMTKASEGALMVLNHEQVIGHGTKAFFNGGWTRSNLRKNITGQGSRLTILDDAGNYAGKYFTRRTPGHKYYVQTGIENTFKTGEVEHDVVLAVDKSWSKSWTGVVGGYGLTNFKGLGGTLAGGVNPNESVNIPTFSNFHNSTRTFWGVSLLDTMKLGKAQMMLGVHKHESNAVTYPDPTKSGKVASVKSSAVCPAYGFVYQPTDEVSIYASHSEFFDAGSRVSGSTAYNADEILDPSKTKMDEIGVKYSNKNFLATLALFKNRESSTLNIYDDKKPDWYWVTNDGENEYKGIELSINGAIADKWNAFGGLMYLDTERVRTNKGTYDGYRVGGIPRFNAVAGLQYKPNNDLSLLARAVYVGPTPIFPASNAIEWEVPSYTTFDAGVNYKTQINKMPVTLSAMCYNLTGKDYWIAYGSGLHLSSPRTFMLSAQFDI